jgi:hypothetical protein
MRSSVMIAATLAYACRGTERDAPAQPAPARTLQGDASPVTVAVALADAGSAAVPNDAPPGATDLTLTVDGSQHALRWGFVTDQQDVARIELFSGPVDCSMSHRDASELPAARLLVSVPSGPGGHYFTGHAIGVWAILVAPVGRAIPPWAAIAKLEPSTWKRGARVRGVIEGHHSNRDGSVGVVGSFDVEVCDVLDDNAGSHVAATAPASPARGAIGKDRIAPKTVLALVNRAPATLEEATSVAAGRSRGSRRSLSFGFFAQANVPCPTTESWDPDHMPQLYLEDPGGAGMEQPLVGTQQPANATFPKTDQKGDRVFRALWNGWVQYDNLVFDQGAKIRGTISVQSPFYEQEKGTFSGRFEATVCDPFPR